MMVKQNSHNIQMRFYEYQVLILIYRILSTLQTILTLFPTSPFVYTASCVSLLIFFNTGAGVESPSVIVSRIYHFSLLLNTVYSDVTPPVSYAVTNVIFRKSPSEAMYTFPSAFWIAYPDV